jgi:hypothetical protein
MLTATKNLFTGGPKGSLAILTSTGSNSTSTTLPSHQPGDFIFLAVFSGGNPASTPGKPTASGTVPAWVTIDSGAAGISGMHVVYFVATASNHTSGTWSGGVQNMVATVVRPANCTPTLGGHDKQNSTTTAMPIIAPAITQTKTDGTSVLLSVFLNNAQGGGVPNAAPAGYTRQILQNFSNQLWIVTNSKDDTTSDGSVSQTSGSTNSGVKSVWGQQTEIYCGP